MGIIFHLRLDVFTVVDFQTLTPQALAKNHWVINALIPAPEAPYFGINQKLTPILSIIAIKASTVNHFIRPSAVMNVPKT